MKYTIILFLGIFILACSNTDNGGSATDATKTVADSNNPVAQKGEEIRTDDEIINAIKEQYKTVIAGRGTRKFKMDSLSYECADYPEIGELVFYTDEAGVWLIEHSCTQGDHGGRTDQYFVWEGELFFLYSDESYWTFDAGTMDDGMQQNTVDYFTERRYYFNKEKVLKCLEKKYEKRTYNKKNPISENVHNVSIEPEDTEERVKRFNQLMNIVGKDDLEGTCIWE